MFKVGFEVFNVKVVEIGGKIFVNLCNVVVGSLCQLDLKIIVSCLLEFCVYGFGQVSGMLLDIQVGIFEVFCGWGIFISCELCLVKGVQVCCDYYDDIGC